MTVFFTLVPGALKGLIFFAALLVALLLHLLGHDLFTILVPVLGAGLLAAGATRCTAREAR